MHWAGWLDAGDLATIDARLAALDEVERETFLRHRRAAPHGGQPIGLRVGPAGAADEPDAFSEDRDWMAELVLVARREDRLRELAGGLRERHGTDVTILPGDLAQPDAARRLHATLRDRNVAVDVLVNNAGFGALGRFVELDARRQIEMVRLNVEVLTELTRLFLPGMLARRHGAILNVGSTAAFQPGPLMAVYYATKAYVQSFTEALAESARLTAADPIGTARLLSDTEELRALPERIGEILRRSGWQPGPRLAGVVRIAELWRRIGRLRRTPTIWAELAFEGVPGEG